jgi:hypothetical protein
MKTKERRNQWRHDQEIAPSLPGVRMNGDFHLEFSLIGVTRDADQKLMRKVI